MNTSHHINSIEELRNALKSVTLQDATRIRSGLQKLKALRGDRRRRLLLSLCKRAERSRTALQVRKEQRAKVKYPVELPVSQARDRICDAIKKHQLIIVCGDTGSGKTTQLPKMLYEMGYGTSGRIGCTQPRRLAAVSMAKRVADEMDAVLREQVGYHVRFDETFSDPTAIKFMTDGILLAESQRDRQWLQYDALIIDEAHERSLNIDFILGCIKQLMPRRPELKIVVSSATIDAERFSEFFHDAPILTVEGRRFPVDDFYLPPLTDDEDLARHVLRGVDWISGVDCKGDILVFLPGEREIHDAADLLKGKNLPNTEVLPLYARLSLNEQQRVFQVGGRRRIVLATNVAETSVTIPGIHYVIDSGLARVKRYNPKMQIERLQVEQISQASANQRRGRCGRIADGICIRLYDEEVYAESEPFTVPEIQRTSLADVILHMKSVRMPDIEDFPFIDPPKRPLVREGYRTLIEIGALSEAGELTHLGREIGRFQVDPRLARMIVEGATQIVMNEAIVLAAMLSIQDPRERPRDKQDVADQAQSEWKDPRSDFMTLLNLWNAWQDLRLDKKSKSATRRFCREKFLNWRRMQELNNLVRELQEVVKELRWKNNPPGKRWSNEEFYKRIQCSVLAGVPLQFGQKQDRRGYVGTKNRDFFVFPGSALFQSAPEWIMAFELVETTKLYARKAAVIDPEWVELVAPHLCRAIYGNPGWNAKKGFVYAEKSMTCGGLTLVSGKRVHYGAVDPVKAHEIFIQQGLVPAEMRVRGAWFRRYRALLSELQKVETKRRRPGSLLDYHGVSQYFDNSLPPHICTARDFERWIQKHADVLPVSIDDLIGAQKEYIRPALYPDVLDVEGVEFKLEYVFDPGELNDGVSVVCPSDKVYLITQTVIDWLVPGWLELKIHALLKTLTKRIRTQLVPLPTTAETFARMAQKGELDQSKRLTQSLADLLHRQLGEIVGPGDFDESRLAGWMKVKIKVVDKKGVCLVETDDLDHAREFAEKSHGGTIGIASEQVKENGTKQWDTEGLPEKAGSSNAGFPALHCTNAGMTEIVFSDADAAYVSHRQAVVGLFRQTHREQVRFVEKRLPLGMTTRLQLNVLGGAYDHFADFIDGTIACAFLQQGDLPRSRKDFDHVAERVRSELYNTAEDIAGQLERVFISCAGIERERISFLQDFDKQQRELFFDGFLLYPEFLPDYQRWARGLEKRAERASYDQNKDAEKQARIAPYIERYHQQDSNAITYARMRGMHLIQEYRISIFAQEIGTRQKVSEKMLKTLFF